jgi:thiamine pyrophosphate-dependent acetolactate synthase large subunit-like protein
VVATTARLKAPMAHTSRGKDFLEYDNPYNVGMTGLIGGAAGYHAILDCDVQPAWSLCLPISRTQISVTWPKRRVCGDIACRRRANSTSLFGPGLRSPARRYCM